MTNPDPATPQPADPLAYHRLYAEFLTRPPALAAATAVHEKFEGTAEEKMAAAIFGALATLVNTAEPLRLPENWDTLSRGALLKHVADQMELPWGLPVEQMREEIRAEQVRREQRADPIGAILPEKYKKKRP